MKPTTKRPISLLVRVPFIGKPLETIAVKHNEALSPDGSVWFGIRGRGPSQARRASLLQQAERGIPTYFYLLQRNGSRFHGFRAPLLAFSDTPPKHSMIPAYYSETDLAKTAALWVNVERFRKVDNLTIDALRVDQTGTPLQEALGRSMACVMVVS
jgi:hypothetical protein